MSDLAVAAVDLGASSGRVVVGRFGDRSLALEEVYRFPNTPVAVRGTVYWNALGLFDHVLRGLRRAGRDRPLSSVGIDSWAVDYGLIDRAGQLLSNPVHYRDARTVGVSARVQSIVDERDLYAITGIQHLPFNTIYQLVSEFGTTVARDAATMLLIPDLFCYWLTGEIGAERTNASTTQLYDVRRHTWSTDLVAAVGLPAYLLPPIREPGDVIGCLTPEVGAEVGLGPSPPVIAVGSHDTASAVVAVPAEGRNFAYISCGTWSLVGVELNAPVLTEDARRANFTNEVGVDSTIRFLRNVMGLWLLQECVRTWRQSGIAVDLPALVAAAADVPGLVALVDPDDLAFLPPGDMPARIVAACVASGRPAPQSPPEIVRCILDSLALGHRRAVRTAAQLSGQRVDAIHLVGGGAHNRLLCQLTADACGIRVLAGPTEATALGNLLVQARTLGAAAGDLGSMRALVRSTQDVRTYSPSPDDRAWDAAEARVWP